MAEVKDPRKKKERYFFISRKGTGAVGGVPGKR